MPNVPKYGNENWIRINNLIRELFLFRAKELSELIQISLYKIEKVKNYENCYIIEAKFCYVRGSEGGSNRKEIEG